MAETLSESEVQRIQQIVNTDPQIQAILQKARSDKKTQTGKVGGAFAQQYSNQIATRLKTLGVNLPHDYGVGLDGSFDRASYLNRNADWIAPVTMAALGAYPYIAQAVGGSSAAGGSTAGLGPTPAAGGVTESTVPPALAAPGGVPAATPAVPDPISKVTSGIPNPLKSLFSKDVLPYVIGGLTSVVGGYIASRGNTKAAEIAAESADKQSAVLKEIYEQQRKDLAPYRDLGLGAIGQLNYGMGYPEQPKPAPSTAPYVVPGAKDKDGNPFPGANPNAPPEVPYPGPTPMGQNGTSGLAGASGSSLASIGQPTSSQGATGGNIMIMAPNGEVRSCTPEVAQRAIQAGGRQL